MHISVKVTPQARRESVVARADWALSISVKEKPERNEANGRVRELLADYFGVPLSRVTMIKGRRAHNKLFLIEIT